MAVLAISRGLHVQIDDADYERVAAFNWFARPIYRSAGGFYAYRSQRYGQRRMRTIYLHRFLLDAPAGMTVDHINWDGLDNRRANLRLATVAQNNANRLYPPNAVGYRGVCKSGRGFRAQVGSGRTVERGPWRASAHTAALDFDEIAFRKFGEYAVLNFGASA